MVDSVMSGKESEPTSRSRSPKGCSKSLFMSNNDKGI